MKRIIFLFLFVAVLVMSGCNLFKKDEDNNNNNTVYDTGIVDTVRFAVEGPHSVRISWFENFSDEEGFRIDRKVWDGEWEYSIQTVGPNVHTVVDTTAELDKVYYYHVYAFKGNAESAKPQIQYNFNLPNPYNIDWDSYSPNPPHIRMYWTNLAPWADSIVVVKKIDYVTVDAHYAVLAGNATEYTDYGYNIQQVTSYGYTAYYQNHQSQQYLVTFMPPK